MDCGVDWSEFDHVIPFGSAGFLRRLKQSPLAHFVHHDEELFAATNWMPIFDTLGLNRGGDCVRASDVTRSSYETFHVRPNKVDKAFSGKVFTKDEWQSLVEQSNIAQDLECWVSPTQEIVSEHRCWIMHGEVVEISQYRDRGKPEIARCVDPSFKNQVQRLTNIYAPNSCVVMDVAKVGVDNNPLLKVIEFNPWQSSGWYGADVGCVLSKVMTSRPTLKPKI